MHEVVHVSATVGCEIFIRTKTIWGKYGQVKHVLHIQYIFSVSLAFFKIIKQKGTNSPGLLNYASVF